MDGTLLGKAGTLALHQGSASPVVARSALSPFQPLQFPMKGGRPMRAPLASLPVPPGIQKLRNEVVSGMCKRWEAPMPSTVARASASSAAPAGRKPRVAVIGGGPSGASAAEVFAEEPNIETFLF